MEIKTIMLLMFVFYSVVFDSCNMQSQSTKNDTLIKLNYGLYYKFTFCSDTSYFVTWGNKNNSFKSKPIEVLGNGSLKLVDYTNTCILLGQSCGTSCTSYVFLPVIPNATERRYLFGKAYNLFENSVAFIPENEALISVQNYLTNKRMDIFENNLCPAAFKGDCIDSCRIINHTLDLYWQGENWDGDKIDPQRKKYKINFK